MKKENKEVVKKEEFIKEEIKENQEKQEIKVEENSVMEVTKDQTNRQLVSVTPLEKKTKKILDVHQGFMQIISKTPLEENQKQDHEEFYKPGGESFRAHSLGSNLSKSSSNKISKKDNNQVGVYTIGNREEPNESFYAERKEAVQHIIDLCHDDMESKDKPMPIVKKLKPKVSARLDVYNFNDDDDDDEDEEEFEDDEDDDEYYSDQLFNVKANSSKKGKSKKIIFLVLKGKI